VPLFAASWRVSILGLALQGCVLGWISLRLRAPVSVADRLALMDLIVIRGLVAPILLFQSFAVRGVSRRNDVIPSNLFAWILVGAFVLVSFRFAAAALRTEVAEALPLATATLALLLGFFVLSSQSSMFSQVVGLLRVENAVVLFELMSPHRLPLAIQAGVSAVFLVTVLLFTWFLRRDLPAASEAPPAEEGPTL
jgi:hydrogenase-4 component E